MAKYRASAVVRGSKYLGEFEASSKRKAEKMALDSEMAYIGLCHQCSDQCEDPEIERVNIELIEEE